jgi:hypothetical protein
MNRAVIALLAVAVAMLGAWSGVSAQRGGPPAAPLTPRQLAPIDLTGTWVAVVTEDWRWRMVTPPKGDVSSVPVNAEGRKATLAWDPEADNAAGNQCKAFGVGGIMRQPGRLRISWQDPSTLKLEFDAGTQTRLLTFDRAAQPGTEKTWQGFARGEWEGPGIGRGPEAPPGPGAGPAGPPVPGGGGRGLRGGPPPRDVAAIQRGGSLKVVTTNFKAGYLRKNGVPYSEQATITEYIHRLPTHPNGDDWLNVVTVVEDPRYLAQPFYTSTNFRREPDATKFAPTPCKTDPPLPVKTGATGRTGGSGR